jgi:hypothetical protein
VDPESSDQESAMENPYAAPASHTVDTRSDEARAAVIAGAVVASLALVRIISCLVTVYAGYTHSGILGDLPRGITATVMYEVMAFPYLAAPIALVYGGLAIPLLRASKRSRDLTLAIQTLYAIFPLLELRRTFVRPHGSVLVYLAVANVLLALLPIVVLRLLLYGQPSPRRLRQASAGIALLCCVWAARLIGIW